ncbi:MAG: DUF6114 domain-containing protein [Nocardioides sp.]
MTDDLTTVEERPGRRRALRRVEQAGGGRAPGLLAVVRQWFRAFRRTRPFWGGLWTMVAGAEIIKAMSFDIGLALTGGWSYSAGYVMGGGLILFGLVAWFAPHYRGLTGILAFLVALGAFPAANLGGYLFGSVVGVVGASMIWSWGPKKPSRRHLAKTTSTD